MRDSKEFNSRQLNLIKKNSSHVSCGLDSSSLRNQHAEMPYSLVLHQSCLCEVKYSEKQIIGLSHRNLYDLYLLSNFSPAKTWLSTRKMIFCSTLIDTTLVVQVLPNRKSLDFDYLKSRQMWCYS